MLHSLIMGEGRPMVILHGFLGMADNWKTLGKQFSENGFNVHILDQRNHGRSPHSDLFDYQEMAQDVKNYCQKHDLSDIILIGHSMGGKIAMIAAQQFPELIEKLIIADIAPKTYPPHHSDIIKALESVDFSKVNRRSDADEMLEPFINDFGTRQFLLKSLYRKKDKSYGWRFNLPVLGAAQNSVGIHEDFIEPVQIPTLFIRGGKSGYITDSDKLLIDHAFAKAELATITEAGHWLHAEQPEKFYDYVIDFVK
ncbi:alpha/beta hydrolase [Nonlabens spongiae]|uniref:Alpha/beta hydrolase n=1 Tax=Nonlabens spongiae TaxID=331648 RepID=A0A1W6MKQ4_9FLAO|nr:alpha/beta fold hydrolase [Nonlabens spongiae]ARN78163.1 alpha/beta hydrolase [Nonlabens spongiae]